VFNQTNENHRNQINLEEDMDRNMKGKIFSVLFALVLVLSLSLVMAVPAAAAAVGTPTVTLSTNLAGAADVVYTISFDIGASLSTGNTITVTFDAAYVTPTTWANGDVTVNGTSIPGASVSTTGDVVTITLPMAVSTSSNPVVVVFTAAANVPNPVVGTYTLSVSTTAETATSSSSYTILALPTVTAVSPAAGNIGDTMWVEITGTSFTGTAATNASTTTISFGVGATVLSTKYVSATSIDCQILVTATGTLSVSATTAAGIGTTVGTFTSSAADTAQVDVWEAYTPTDTVFDAATLIPRTTTMTYATIALAEAACDGTETVLVHPATYAENIVINQHITLQSMAGPATTIIDASDETAEAVRGAVQIMTNTVTLGGDGVGFTIIAPDATEALPDQYGVELFVDGATAGVTIEGNTICGSTNEDSESPQVGIHLWGTGPYTTLTIKDNTLTTTYTVDMDPLWTKTSAGIITAANVAGCQGTFDGNTITGYSIGMDLELLNTSTTAIFGNTVQNCDFNGIYVSGTGAIDVYSNTISGCGGNGLGIGGAQSDIDVYENSIHGNGNGVKLYSTVTDATKVTLAYNDIYSNTNTTLPAMPEGEEITYENDGVLNDGTGTLAATYNWWGHIGGPGTDSTDDTPSVAKGNGDVISTGITYDPWLTKQYATVIEDGVRSYGSEALPLAIGWNTLSVPCGLKDSANTFGEIASLGSYIVSTGDTANYLGGYYFDAATSTWAQIYSDTALVPGKGYYVRMSAVSTFPVLYYDGSLNLPSYDLLAGWNLVGSMFGIDHSTWDVQVEATKESNVALASLGASAAVIISPSVPGQTENWATVFGTGETMYVGEAYWVFMTASGTLAGFEVTPFNFTWTAP
jgi:parallel beta-helix repeat protein